MSELTSRLRSGASTSLDVSSHFRKYQALCDEAADEITRLRASERSAWNAAVVRDEEITRLRAALSTAREDALREAAKEAMVQPIKDPYGEWEKGYATACEENARNILALIDKPQEQKP